MGKRQPPMACRGAATVEEERPPWAPSMVEEWAPRVPHLVPTLSGIGAGVAESAGGAAKGVGARCCRWRPCGRRRRRGRPYTLRCVVIIVEERWCVPL